LKLSNPEVDFFTEVKIPPYCKAKIFVMPVPFGFGVGDFIAVGGLIKKVVQELKDVSSLLQVVRNRPYLLILAA
jgi:hypothetical protein